MDSSQLAKHFVALLADPAGSHLCNRDWVDHRNELLASVMQMLAHKSRNRHLAKPNRHPAPSDKLRTLVVYARKLPIALATLLADASAGHLQG